MFWRDHVLWGSFIVSAFLHATLIAGSGGMFDGVHDRSVRLDAYPKISYIGAYSALQFSLKKPTATVPFKNLAGAKPAQAVHLPTRSSDLNESYGLKVRAYTQEPTARKNVTRTPSTVKKWHQRPPRPRVEDIDLSDTQVFRAFSSYFSFLSAHIARHISYPPEVLEEAKEGMVYVTFEMHRVGQVSKISLVESSGDPRFDRAALQSIRNSVPFPRFPPEIKEEKITLYLPISFEVD